MKYKVVVDNGNLFGCNYCCFKDDKEGCAVIGNKHKLVNCIQRDCHFELADEITTKDLLDIDKSMEEKE